MEGAADAAGLGMTGSCHRSGEGLLQGGEVRGD